MKQEIEIILSKLFNNSLNTRESVEILVARINNEILDSQDVHVILNFENIEFMSRSFADEFHKVINQEDFNIGLTFKNMSSDMLAMLKAVENTQNKRSNTLKKPTVISIKDIKTLENYAFSW